MDPERRILVKVTMEDAMKADEIFTLLMGMKLNQEENSLKQMRNM